MFVDKPCALRTAWVVPTWMKKERSCTSSAQQRSLHLILACCPSTASGTQYCLLCCQPEPMPRYLTASVPQVTLRDPCSPLAWRGQAIYMICRTCRAPWHSIAQVRIATGVAPQLSSRWTSLKQQPQPHCASTRSTRAVRRLLTREAPTHLDSPRHGAGAPSRS